MNNLIFQFKPVWSIPVPTGYQSIMMKKGSQYTRLLTKELMKMTTTGNIHLLKQRYSGIQCKQQLKEKPLGYEKLSFLFVMLIFSCIMSIIIVFIEYMTQNKKKKQESISKAKEIEEKICKCLEVEGMPDQEKENILGRLFQKYHEKNKDLNG